MNYSPYGYSPVFAPQRPSGAFYGGTAPIPAYAPQSAPAPQNGQISAGFAVQPVTSREEALAVIADPLAAGVLLPDLGHGVIYMKRFNPNTGASDFGEFRLAQPAAENPVETVEYVSRKDFEAALAQLRAELAAAQKEAAHE